ncbi:hypothetical protein [Elongatibacter sediminis]|uniref:Uncharacterized protein n=1 Tax=Elongatibacter sediminis TaxID=3119006 RepID=A0AAW9R773_9GAMM
MRAPRLDAFLEGCHYPALSLYPQAAGGEGRVDPGSPLRDVRDDGVVGGVRSDGVVGGVRSDGVVGGVRDDGVGGDVRDDGVGGDVRNGGG